MRHLGHSGRTDRNQAAIVEGLRLCGYSVQSLAPMGHGVPDLLVGCNDGGNLLFEIKSDKGELTDDQIKWARGWNGPVYIVRSLDEALRRCRQAKGW